MGLAMVVGWTMILGGAAVAAVVWVFLLRSAAYHANAPVHAAWITAAATVAGTASASSLFRHTGFNVSSSHEAPLPHMLGTAFVVASILGLALRRVAGDPASPGHAAAMRWVCTLLVVVPPAVWFVLVPVPAWREEARNRVRGDYDQAQCENDAARARAILRENPWLAYEIEHALDGTVPAEDFGDRDASSADPDSQEK